MDVPLVSTQVPVRLRQFHLYTPIYAVYRLEGDSDLKKLLFSFVKMSLIEKLLLALLQLNSSKILILALWLVLVIVTVGLCLLVVLLPHELPSELEWMSKKYKCCDARFDLVSWLDHAEVCHHFTEILKCPECAVEQEVLLLREHVGSEHLISCPHSGCSFISDSFDRVQEHVACGHPGPSGSSALVSQDGETSRRITALLKSIQGVKNVRLARHLVLHKTGAEDRGFGCGFRNLQTLVSSLMFEPDLRKASGFSQIPSISQIQVDIERAWNEGFDPMGAAQLSRRLLGTRKWIGATEVATFLQFHHLRIQLVDIKLHVDRVSRQKRLVDWVKQYFQSADTPLPLYFQHEGHSRTIIGVEEKTNGCSLVVYDPSTSPERIEKALKAASAKGLSFLRFPVSSLTHREYQIVAVRGVLPAECYETAKDFTMFNHVEL